jgi:pyrroloquinoline quinone (PQQ) biosynthesis protein C
MLEEMGLDEEGVSHPALLFRLAGAAGFDPAARAELERLAQEELRRVVSDPILFGTLKEVALGVLIETTAFEWMLSRTARRMAGFLAEHRGLPREGLEWFYHHSEVDVRHAAEGLRAVADFIEFYEFDPEDTEIIFDVTFRENVFIKRYFSEFAVAGQAGA